MTTLFYLLVGVNVGFFAHLFWDLVKMARMRRVDRHLAAATRKED